MNLALKFVALYVSDFGMNLRTARVVVGLRVCVRLPWNVLFKLIKTITVLAANIDQLGILNGHVPMRLIKNVPGLV